MAALLHEAVAVFSAQEARVGAVQLNKLVNLLGDDGFDVLLYAFNRGCRWASRYVSATWRAGPLLARGFACEQATHKRAASKF